MHIIFAFSLFSAGTIVGGCIFELKERQDAKLGIYIYKKKIMMHLRIFSPPKTRNTR